ncbi:MAG: signal peptidase I [Lachnospiraceae bacterium]|nr:signal peptidase I [Lachnospiraceae bacterium]
MSSDEIDKTIQATEQNEERYDEVPENAEEASASTEADGTSEEANGRNDMRKVLRTLVGDVVFFLGCLIATYLLFSVFPPYFVDGTSMNNTLRDRAFGFGIIFFTPDYGDIVVIHGENGKTNDSDYIKRVIGKPGDTLRIIDGVVYRNGECLDEPYAYYDPGAPRSGVIQEISLGEDEYLVMGDNRFHSYDGRGFGPISRSEMKCKMLFFLWGKKR